MKNNLILSESKVIARLIVMSFVVTNCHLNILEIITDPIFEYVIKIITQNFDYWCSVYSICTYYIMRFAKGCR